jgi:hypothetical protein
VVRYETYLAFAGNSRTLGLGTHSGLKELCTILGEEGWRVCAVWPSMQGGVSGMAVLCQRPIEPSVIEAGLEHSGRLVDVPPALIEDSVNMGSERRIETVTVTKDQIEEGFTCPRCSMTSHNPTDIVEGYCGNCHEWTGRPTPE